MSRRRALAAGLFALGAGGCLLTGAPEERPSGPIHLVLKVHSLGDPGPLDRLLSSFERAHPGVVVTVERLPNAAGAVHQYYVTALEGRTRDFDVLLIDVIWVAEVARAGWIADLSATFPPDRIRRDFLPGAASAVVFQGATFGVPWYVDVGVLFRRTDLVPAAPKTYDELIAAAVSRRPRGHDMRGYVWQGLQSEALVCNVFEAIWGHGGLPASPDAVELDTPEARDALGYLRGLLARGVSPPSVTTMAEEESRRVFQLGSSVLMRNWPYAYAEAQRPGSAVRGRVGVSPLPTLTGEAGHGALGGFQLALNANTPRWKVEAAHALIAHLSSLDANVVLALSYGRLPARRAAYEDPRVVSGAPMIAGLLPAAVRARPRPVTPYYPMIADTLAAEFSAAITGVRSPAESLRRAQALADHLVREVT
jgi:multiple sugar transport system substrate-binding protein